MENTIIEDEEEFSRLINSDWPELFKGSPLSIMVPPLIRFQSGITILYSALNFLMITQHIAKTDHPRLLDAMSSLEESPTAKSLNINYDTFFASHLTINLVSETEHFFANAVSAALLLHPEKMSSQKFSLSDILSASSNDELINRAARSVMNKLMYEKPMDYVKSLADILSIDASEIEEPWLRFVEIKARRDIGVHNNWKVNEIYLRKLSEAKIHTDHSLNDLVIPDFEYLHEAIDTCYKLGTRLANVLAKKWMPAPTDRENGT